MLSKIAVERTAGVLMLLIVALSAALAAVGFGVDASLEPFRNDFRDKVVQNQDKFAAGLVLSSAMSVAMFGAAGALYGTFRLHERTLATVGAYGFLAGGVLLLVGAGSGVALHDLAGEWSAADAARAEQVLTSARAVAIEFEFLSNIAFLLLVGGVSAFGGLTAWTGAMPRWLSALAVLSGVLLLLGLTVGLVTGALWDLVMGSSVDTGLFSYLMFGSFLTTVLWLSVTGGWLLVRGTKDAGTGAA